MSMEQLMTDIRAAKKKMQEGFADYVADWLRANPDTPFLAICGYTPDFNDGEPCEFDAELIEFDYCDADDYGVEKLFDEKGWTSEVDFGSASSDLQISTKEIQDVLQATYNSHGFVVVYYLEDGNLKTFLNDDYDCGY